MRLTVSLALWLVSLTAIVLGANGWVQLHTEKTDLAAAARRELALVTTAVRSAVENAIRDHQEPDVTELLQQLVLKDPAVDVFVFNDDGSLLGSSVGSEGNLAEMRALLARTESLDTLGIEEAGARRFVARTPLRVQGELRGQLVIVRPSETLLADLARERRAVLVSMGLLMVVLSIVLWAVVHVRIHRPMSQVIAGVRRVSSGDLSARINMPGRDEVAELANEFDTMAEALETARSQLTVEAEKREQLEFDMQRANKLASVGEVAATLAHEIGSPLQVLNGRARDLAASAELPDDARRSAGVLVEQTKRVHQIVERLLEVARRKAPRPREIDVRGPLERVVELMSTQARRREVSLELEIGDIPTLLVDPDQLQQVVLNLIQNALRACTPGGGIRVTAGPSSFPRNTDAKHRPSIAITVEDSGTGIAEELRGSIFEPFYTAWDETTGTCGTGLGLSVVKSIMTDHGGVVSVAESPSGVGARFTVHFPLEHARSTEAS